jgi:outer membrane protein OmpA-like peptidoglycan-associated protein
MMTAREFEFLGELEDEFEEEAAELEPIFSREEATAQRFGEMEGEQALACPRPTRVTVSGFTRYSNSVASLPPNEQAKIKNIATLIITSFQPGCKPLLGIMLIGHADRDWQRGPAFERQISVQRALQVRSALSSAINNLGRGSSVAAGARFLSSIDWQYKGAGASRLVVPNPTTEQQRARNRRVEIFSVPRSYPARRPLPSPARLS